MASPPASDADRTAFLVERYLPPAAADSLSASVARVARLCADTSRSGPGVQYLHSAYLPTEDTCFCLFRGPSSDAVREVNSDADFPLDRITDALLLLPSSSRTSDATYPREQSASSVAAREGQK
jgi:hypothetical protein